MNKQLSPIEQKISTIKKYLSKENLRSQVEENYIKKIISQNPDLKEKYIIEYIDKIQRTGADPILNEIYLTSYFSKKLGEKLGTTIFSYTYMLRIANQTGEFERCEAESAPCNRFNPFTGKTKTELAGIATVYRKNKGSTKKVRWFDSFNQPMNPIWKKMPEVMIEKVAIVAALRSAFPEVLNGCYIQEEMSGEESEVLQQEIRSVENEKAIEKSELDKAKMTKRIEDTKSFRKKEPKINLATEFINKITSGFTLDQKFEFLNNELGIDSIERMKAWSGKELDLQISRLEKMFDSPIVMPKDELKEG